MVALAWPGVVVAATQAPCGSSACPKLTQKHTPTGIPGPPPLPVAHTQISLPENTQWTLDGEKKARDSPPPWRGPWEGLGGGEDR